MSLLIWTGNKSHGRHNKGCRQHGFCFFGKTKHQVLCSLYWLPCRICGEIQAACTGHIPVLAKSPVSSWWIPAVSGGHTRSQMWAKSHIRQVLIEETQTHSQAQEAWDQTSHHTTWACRSCTGDLRAERLKVMLRWDELHWGWMWEQEKAVPVTAYSHSSLHWGHDGLQRCCYRKPFLILLWVLFSFLTTEVYTFFFQWKNRGQEDSMSLFIKQSPYLRSRSHSFSQSSFGTAGTLACPFHNIKQ